MIDAHPSVLKEVEGLISAPCLPSTTLKYPVITDGDETIAESGATLEYLVETYGAKEQGGLADFQMSFAVKATLLWGYWWGADEEVRRTHMAPVGRIRALNSPLQTPATSGAGHYPTEASIQTGIHRGQRIGHYQLHRHVRFVQVFIALALGVI